MHRHTAVAAAVAVIALALVAAGCGGRTQEDEAPPPAVVEHVKGSAVVRVRLSAEAARRIGIRTAPVRTAGSGTRALLIPYDALLYDPDGGTWAYVNPTPLVFERADVRVLRIQGRFVLLAKGPPAGARVVTEGATEIWGVEYGGIEED